MSQRQPSITDFVRWIRVLQDGSDELKSGLDARAAEEFEAGLRQIADDLRNHPDRQNEIGLVFRQLMDRYSYPNRWLQERDPLFKRLQAGAESDLSSAQVRSAASTRSTNESSSTATPPTTETRSSAQADITSEVEDRTQDQAASDASGTHQSRTRSGTTERPDDMSKRTGKHPWTPELKIQFFKEIFTALLALIIIGFTLTIAFRSFNMAGDAKKMADAKDLLTVMLGVAGVVVGYYFGRVPSDARAAQATTRADAAVDQREQIKAKVRGIADNMDDAIAESAYGATRSGQPSADLSRMRALRDELHDLASTES